MDNTELHYLTYDPEEIWDQMMINYVDAGGDILYPGDEKDMKPGRGKRLTRQRTCGLCWTRLPSAAGHISASWQRERSPEGSLIRSQARRIGLEGGRRRII